MRLPRNLFFLALALTIVSVCSAQDNQNPIPRSEFEKKDSGTTIKPLETESSERSTEQGTSPANTQLARLARSERFGRSGTTVGLLFCGEPSAQP